MSRSALVSACRSAAVFSGKLVAVDEQDLKSTFTFAVMEIFKGELDPKVQVKTIDGAVCPRSYGFDELEGEWLIYAKRGRDGQLRDQFCSRSRALAKANEDIRQLEKVDVDALDDRDCFVYMFLSLA